jgi:hypothetical protein
MPRRYVTLVFLLAVVVGCAPLAALAPKSIAKAGSASEVTLIYTGYNRGNVDPQADCG